MGTAHTGIGIALEITRPDMYQLFMKELPAGRQGDTRCKIHIQLQRKIMSNTRIHRPLCFPLFSHFLKEDLNRFIYHFEFVFPLPCNLATFTKYTFSERSSDEEYMKHHKSTLPTECKIFGVKKLFKKALN